jgi:hypothetical protein
MMYRAVIQRAMHDACGATVVAPTEQMQLRYATDAWNFLYSDAAVFRNERWLVCEYAGVDPEALESRMAIAAIRRPTGDILKHAWTNLELAYWRLGGCVGQMPVPRAERIERQPRRRGGHNRGKSYVPKPRRQPTRALNRYEADTLLFSRRVKAPAATIPAFPAQLGLGI